MLRKKRKGSLIIEGMVGVFFIGIVTLIMISTFGTYNKVTKSVRDVENRKEIEGLIVKEIIYNSTYCEALALFSEEKQYCSDINYYREKVRNNMEFLTDETKEYGDNFKVKLIKNESNRLVFSIVSDKTEEVYFYKYQIY